MQCCTREDLCNGFSFTDRLMHLRTEISIPLADRSANINRCIDFRWADGVKTWGWDRSATQIQLKNVNTKLLGAIRKKCQNPTAIWSSGSRLAAITTKPLSTTLNRPRLQHLRFRQRFPRHQKKQYATNDHIHAHVCVCVCVCVCAARHLHLSFNTKKIRLHRLNKVPLLSQAQWKDYSRRRKTRGY